MRAKEEAFRILEAALSLASSGVDEAEVALGGGSLGRTRFADNQVYPAQDLSREVVSIRAVVDGRVGRIVTSDMSTAGIKEAAQQLRVRVEHLPETVSGHGLPPPQGYEEIDAYDPDTDALEELDREYLASRAVLTAVRSNLKASGEVSVQRGPLAADGRVGLYAVANTRGLLAYHAETRVRYGVRMVGPNGGRGWSEDAAFTLSALEPEALVENAVRRAALGGAPRKLPSGTYSVILEPAAVAELLKRVADAAGEEYVRAGVSFAKEAGQDLLPESISLRDDHTHALHRGVPFDAEGVARRRVDLIDKGKSGNSLRSFHWGEGPTGHREMNAQWLESERADYLVMEGGASSFSDLVAATEVGVLISRLSVTELLDPTTVAVSGTTRDGTFLIENGEATTQLEPVGFTVSVLDVLRATERLTAATWANGAVAPAIQTKMPLRQP